MLNRLTASGRVPNSLVSCWLATFVLAAAPLHAADDEPGSNGPRLDKELVQRWQVGVIITARGPCVGIVATAPVPTDWPEQKVKVIDEERSPEVTGIGYRVLNNGVKQLLVQIPQLGPGRTAKALVTLEVARSSTLGPDDPSQLVVAKRPPGDVRRWLGQSPYIETRSSEIRKLAKEIVEGKETAWEQVEAIYDWVRDHVEYKEGKLKGALAALHDKTGDCEELTSLFIALCRANKIPARTVWIPGHCYPEFYLEDDQGEGYWFPCQAAGTRAFGSMPEHRPILQKGDNFVVPENRKAQRYVSEFLKTQSVGGQPPDVEFVRKLLPAN